MDIEEVQIAWSGAVARVGGDVATQALIGGANYRVSVLGAFKAAFYTITFYLRGQAALAAPMVAPLELGELAANGWEMVTATLDAVRERMGELAYATCHVLSGAGEQGMTEAQLREAVGKFLGECDPAKLPWYLGFSPALLAQARASYAVESGFPDALAEMRKKEFTRRQEVVLWNPLYNLSLK